MISMILLKIQHVALEHGLILVDTKYEFGKGSDGSILLIDEVRCIFMKRFPALSHIHITHANMCTHTYLCVHMQA